MKKVYCLILPILFAGSHSFSQSANISTFLHSKDRKADYYFDQFAYRQALEIYLQGFGSGHSDFHTRERIAKCYVKLEDPASAEHWYRNLVKEPDAPSSVMFEYAEVLLMNGKYQDARLWFSEYLKREPADPVANEKIELLRDLSKYTENDHRFMIYHEDFNTARSEFGVRYFRKGMAFASSRNIDVFVKHKAVDRPSAEESTLNIFYAEKNTSNETVNLFPFSQGELKTGYHEGPIAFNDDFSKAAFTRSNLRNGKAVYSDGNVRLGIFFADVSTTGRIENVIPFEFNHDAYSNAHPSFSASGNALYFSSTNPAGHGGSDVYVSTRLNGRWTEPENVGTGVNTKGDEFFPFMANDSTLYFSSNGHGSLGGLDIYVSYKRHGQFGKPINLGSPINTQFDDFSFVCDSTVRSGHLASNRAGGKGSDDIYGFIAMYYSLAGEVRQIGENKNVAGVKISVYDKNGNFIDSTRTDPSGYYHLDVPFDQDMVIRAEKEDFELLDDIEFSSKGKPFGVDSLLIPIWKKDLLVKGRVFSNETQAMLPGAEVRLLSEGDGKTDSVQLTDSAAYEFLVRPDKKYRIEAGKEGFISSGFKLDTEALVKGELLNDIVLEEVYINKQVILFEYDRHVISGEAAKLLDEIIKTLRRHPRTTLSVVAHADSRGTKEYNTALSRNRANATARYIISKGIAASRISRSWFGEALILNRCSDGVECPEEEHSKNRRAELKVQDAPVE